MVLGGVVVHPSETTAKISAVTSQKTELIVSMIGVPRFSGEKIFLVFGDLTKQILACAFRAYQEIGVERRARIRQVPQAAGRRPPRSWKCLWQRRNS